MYLFHLMISLEKFKNKRTEMKSDEVGLISFAGKLNQDLKCQEQFCYISVRKIGLENTAEQSTCEKKTTATHNFFYFKKQRTHSTSKISPQGGRKETEKSPKKS